MTYFYNIIIYFHLVSSSSILSKCNSFRCNNLRRQFFVFLNFPLIYPVSIDSIITDYLLIFCQIIFLLLNAFKFVNVIIQINELLFHIIIKAHQFLKCFLWCVYLLWFCLLLFIQCSLCICICAWLYFIFRFFVYLLWFIWFVNCIIYLQIVLVIVIDEWAWCILPVCQILWRHGCCPTLVRSLCAWWLCRSLLIIWFDWSLHFSWLYIYIQTGSTFLDFKIRYQWLMQTVILCLRYLFAIHQIIGFVHILMLLHFLQKRRWWSFIRYWHPLWISIFHVKSLYQIESVILKFSLIMISFDLVYFPGIFDMVLMFCGY